MQSGWKNRSDPSLIIGRPTRETPTVKLRTFSISATLAGSLLLGGCATTSSPEPIFDAASFFECREEALALDAAALHGGTPAQYARAGRLAGQCVEEAGPDYGAHETEVMRLHLLSVLDLLRGGHVAEARDTLRAFEARFPGRDLRGASQTSLLDALALLVSAEGADAKANVSRTLSAEIARIEHWRRQ